VPATTEKPSAASPRRWFYAAATLLMLIGVAAAFVQKSRESKVARTGAIRAAAGLQPTEDSRIEVQQIIRDARYWQSASLTAVFLSILSWGIALTRRENTRASWAVLVSLFALYVALQLMMV
jgi:hypothetical protein